MGEMLTGPKKIVDGLTEVFRGLTQMCEGMAEQIELLEFTSEDAEDEDIFEEQNIRTDDPTCDFVLSILAAVAQDESHSISENEKAAYAWL